MAVCTKRMIQAMKGLVEKDVKWDTNYCFIFDSWFASKRSSEDAMNIGAGMISMVETNTKWFCKDIVQKTTKYQSVGS